MCCVVKTFLLVPHCARFPETDHIEYTLFICCDWKSCVSALELAQIGTDANWLC